MNKEEFKQAVIEALNDPSIEVYWEEGYKLMAEKVIGMKPYFAPIFMEQEWLVKENVAEFANVIKKAFEKREGIG